MVFNWGLVPHVVTGFSKCFFISAIYEYVSTVNLHGRLHCSPVVTSRSTLRLRLVSVQGPHLVE